MDSESDIIFRNNSNYELTMTKTMEIYVIYLYRDQQVNSVQYH